MAMKNDKKVFILIEAVLAAIVLAMAIFLLSEKSERDMDKVSVIVQNSGDNQWAAFIYGLKMAAADQKVELLVVNTEAMLTVEEQKGLIESEIENGSDAIIVQPVPGLDTQEMLKRVRNRVPVMQAGCAATKERDASVLPTTEPDHYAMGKALAEELLNDYNGNLDGKTIGILMEPGDSEASKKRKQGFKDGIKDAGAKIRWTAARTFEEDGDASLEDQPEADLVVALDDNSLTTAGECSAANNLHGAIVYGIGNSTEAAYYLDAGYVECLVVPDEFNVGYQSLTEIAESLGNRLRRSQDITVSYTIIRSDTLFSKENQEILFTMSQ